MQQIVGTTVVGKRSIRAAECYLTRGGFLVRGAGILTAGPRTQVSKVSQSPKGLPNSQIRPLGRGEFASLLRPNYFCSLECRP